MKRLVMFVFLATCGCSFAQGTWMQKATVGGSGRHGAVGFSIGGKGYIGLGNGNNNSPVNDFWEYDPSTNSWTQKANFGGVAREYAVGFSIGTKGYVGTGGGQDFWEYDPSANAWVPKANFGGTSRLSAVGFSIGNKGYIGTGLDSTNFNRNRRDFWEYDPSTDSWTEKANFGGVARYGAAGFSIGNKGYIGTGGDSAYHGHNDFWEYDPSADSWTQKADFGGAQRNFAVGFSIGAKGYIGSGNFNDFWEYNPTTDQWLQIANLSGTWRYNAVGFSIGTKGYLGTGYVPVYYSDDFYEFTPDSIIGINEIHPSCFISVYPNPTNGKISVESNSLNNYVMLFNEIGKLILHDTVRASHFSIDISNLANGVYFLTIIQNDKQIHQKIFKE